jgi:hypothetical protein
MVKEHATMIAAVLLSVAASALAQQPPRPDETPRVVTLSLTEYNRLIDLANRPPQGTAIAPVPAVLASADLRVRVERDTARGVFNLSGNALRDGVSRVSLLSGATLVDANAGGRPLPLMIDGTAHTALVPGPGPFALTLDWGAPLAFAPGRASFVLPVPQAGTARATIDVPGEQTDIRVSTGLVTNRSVVAGRTLVEVTLDPGSSTEVWWSVRDSAPSAAAREVRALADVLTLVTLADSDVRMVALIDVTVVQGELRTLALQLPNGYELTGVSGSSLESSETRADGVTLIIATPAARNHQFLVSLERPHAGGSLTIETGVVAVRDVQRERGEVAIEGVGTLELTAPEREGLHRIDVRELNQALRSLSRLPVLAAFRYQRGAAPPPALSLEVKRFADVGVLAAIADRAVATTLVTSEGRALTEVSLQVQNRAQPFLKVTLPAGAMMVSVEVAGETAKPVLGADGTRVPLLRPGFRPNGPYQVSFVYLHAGTPFARKGELQMTLPKMDIPVGIVEWEMFVPDRYSVRAVDGNAIDWRTIADDVEHNARGSGSGLGAGFGGGTGGGAYRSGTAAGQDVRFGVPVTRQSRVRIALIDDPRPGIVRGRATDVSGAALPGVSVVVDVAGTQRTAVTGNDGSFAMAELPSGQATLTASLAGFASGSASFMHDGRARQVEFELELGSLTETVTVSGNTPADAAKKLLQPSQNVVNLQRKTAGVLPVRVDVPRAGASHRFVKPLVVDQETVVTLRYKRR